MSRHSSIWHPASHSGKMLVKIEAGVVVCWVPLTVPGVDERCVVEMVRRSPGRNAQGSVYQSLTCEALIDRPALGTNSYRPPMTMWNARPIRFTTCGIFGPTVIIARASLTNNFKYPVAACGILLSMFWSYIFTTRPVKLTL
jgi:hypothetical protein